MRIRISVLIAVLVGMMFGEKTETRAGQVPDNMVWIPPGTFTMGSPITEVGRFPNEVQHQVTISRGLYMSKYETTQGEYLAIMGNNPSHFTGDSKLPVENVTWAEATNYCGKLTLQERTAGRLLMGYIYRLPTEAEWEYACRAGTTTRFNYGDDPDYSALGNYAWYLGNSFTSTKPTGIPFDPVGYYITYPTGLKLPNPWGLYDMHGNVWEWCFDWHGAKVGEKFGGTYSTESVTDPRGPTFGFYRVMRGGAFYSSDWICRSANHNGYRPTERLWGTGFRPVLAWDFESYAKEVFGKLPTPAQPTYSTLPKKEDGKDSLVVVTHGWIPKETGQKFPPDPTWVDDMVNAISNNVIVARGLKNWQVEGYKWKDTAWMEWEIMVGGTLLDNAKKEGINLGNYLKGRNLKHIHFIGHSGGARVIETASEILKGSDKTITIHETFLDAYVGASEVGRSEYGQNADWSDSYFARDSETWDGFFTRTAGHLDHAYGVEVTWLDQNKTTVTVNTSGNGITGNVPCSYTVTSHGWPHEFYYKTIPPETAIGAEGFGFPLSKEGGGWDFATNTYPVQVGSSYIKVLGRPDSDCSSTFGDKLLPTYLEPVVDLSKVRTVPSTPDFNFLRNNGNGLIITVNGRAQKQSLQSTAKKAAASSSESTWIAATVTFTNRVNFVSFDAEFLSVKSEGLLTTYTETNLVGSVDGRVVLPGLQHYNYAFPTTANGSLTFGFRLDSFGSAGSSVVITNVSFGFFGIREPFSLTVTGTDKNSAPVFKLTGTSGYNYRLESSSNLLDWSTAAILVNTNGVVSFSDPSPTTNRRFYRAVVP